MALNGHLFYLFDICYPVIKNELLPDKADRAGIKLTNRVYLLITPSNLVIMRPPTSSMKRVKYKAGRRLSARLVQLSL